MFRQVICDKTYIIRHKSVSAALRKDGRGNDKVAPLPVTRGSNQLLPAILGCSLALMPKRVGDLGEFPTNKLIVFSAVAVVFDENSMSFFVSIAADQPSRAFGNEPNGKQQRSGHQALETER